MLRKQQGPVKEQLRAGQHAHVTPRARRHLGCQGSESARARSPSLTHSLAHSLSLSRARAVSLARSLYGFADTWGAKYKKLRARALSLSLARPPLDFADTWGAKDVLRGLLGIEVVDCDDDAALAVSRHALGPSQAQATTCSTPVLQQVGMRTQHALGKCVFGGGWGGACRHTPGVSLIPCKKSPTLIMPLCAAAPCCRATNRK